MRNSRPLTVRVLSVAESYRVKLSVSGGTVGAAELSGSGGGEAPELSGSGTFAMELGPWAIAPGPGA